MILQLDLPLFFSFNQNLAKMFGEPLWVLATNLGDGFFLFPIAMLLLRKRSDTWLPMLFSILVGAVIINVSKSALGMVRPHGILGSELVNVIGPVLEKRAFPSGHTATIFLLVGIALIHLPRKARNLMLLLGSLTGLSRIAVGAHWPSDVLAGAWVGIVCAIMGNHLARGRTAGLKTRAGYVILGLIAALVLPFYDNGFQAMPYLVVFQCLLAALAFYLAIEQLVSLIHHYADKDWLFAKKLWLKQLLFRFAKFGFVGASGFIVDLGLYSLLTGVIGVPHLIARGSSYWMTASWNWFWNRTLTFSNNKPSAKSTQWGKYMLMCLISFVPNWGTYYVLTSFAPIFTEHKQLALIAGVFAGMLFNFTIASLYVFSDPEKTLAKEP